MTQVRIDICCNDPDNGLLTDRAVGIQLQDSLAELEANDMRGPIFRELDGNVRLGRRTFPIVGSKEWFGNWCWNAYWFEAPVAVDLLMWLHSQQTFALSCGEARLFAAWKRDAPLNAEFLERQLIKAALAEQRGPA